LHLKCDILVSKIWFQMGHNLCRYKWDALTGKQKSESQQNTKWASWTRVLGFPVMGVWAPGSDGGVVTPLPGVSEW
jgi:hypothetical protein